MRLDFDLDGWDEPRRFVVGGSVSLRGQGKTALRLILEFFRVCSGRQQTPLLYQTKGAMLNGLS